MRPIDADALNAKFEEIKNHPQSTFQDMLFLDGAMSMVDGVPTLDYAPVVHGEFEFQEFEYIPGLCVAPVHCKTCDTTYFTINKDGKRTACCPYCGARMDGKVNDNG